MLKIDEMEITPDILFRRYSSSMPANALGGASTYYTSTFTEADSGILHYHITRRQDPTPALGGFDAFVLTNFSSQIQWDDVSLNENTYHMYTMLYHEIMHALGFGSRLRPVVHNTNGLTKRNIFNLQLYKDNTLLQSFFHPVSE